MPNLPAGAEQLAPIGRAWLKVVRTRWPEFLAHARCDHGSLVIEFASPHSPDGTQLYLQADGDLDEMIVGFGGGHSHGGAWQATDEEPDPPDLDLSESVRFVEAILAEDVVGYALKSGGGIGELEWLRAQPKWPDVVCVRSWRGTHDFG